MPGKRQAASRLLTRARSPAIDRARQARSRTLRFEELEGRRLLALTAAGSEALVNTFTPGLQEAPAVGVDPQGNYVIAWDGYGKSVQNFTGIYAQRYNALGVAEGAAFQVNTGTTANATMASVAMDSNGDFVIAWQAGSAQSASVYFQRYNAAGVAQGGNVKVNPATIAAAEPKVAMDSAGDFAIAWQTNYQDSSGYGIFAQRYTSSGAATGATLQVNTFTAGDQTNPVIDMDSIGEFVVAWQSYGEDGSGEGIFARRYNAAGTPSSAEFQVNTFTTGNQVLPSLALDSQGDFIIAWSSQGQDGNGYGVFAQRYTSAGNKQAGEFAVNTYTSGNQQGVNVAMDDAGDFVIAWQSAGEDGSGQGVYERSYTSAGFVQTGEIRVNTTTSGNQQAPAVAMDSAGDAAIAWESYGQDGSGYGVYAQRYTNPSSGVPLTITGDDTTTYVQVTFIDSTDFIVNVNGTSTSYQTSTTSSVVYTGASGVYTELIFSDPYNTYAATESFSDTKITGLHFSLDASGVSTVYVYNNSGRSTATVNVANSASGNNFYVDSLASGYSSIADPGDGLFSELAGFVSENVTGAGGTTYAYVYSTSQAAVVGDPRSTTVAAGGVSLAIIGFPEEFLVGTGDGTDSMTLDSVGYGFVATPGVSYVTGTSGGTNFVIAALYCAHVTAQAAGTSDTSLFDSYSHDVFNGSTTSASLTGSETTPMGNTYNFVVTGNNFPTMAVLVSGDGTDQQNLTSPGSGKFVSTSTTSTLTVGSINLIVYAYVNVSGQGQVPVPRHVTVNGTSSDSAYLYYATGSDHLDASGSSAVLSTASSSVAVNKFGNVTVFLEKTDTVHQGAIDYALALVGSWTND